ncbi:hypothetical protein [Kitasatospora sp. NPDC056181]|uniref:hypothetical protein n=1 Tax=Kitasatospora sp. NPDC056181 TaxID=3345737 RepID=UPI0035DE141F
MTMLNRLSLGLLPPVSFDKAYGDNSLRAAADALTRRADWRPARDLLLSGGNDWALKDHRVQYLSDRPTVLPALQNWAKAEPGSADALTVLSRANIARA